MPVAIIKTVSEVCDISKTELEERWETAKKNAGDRSEDYPYVMGIFKHSLGKTCTDKLVKIGWTPIKWKKEEFNKSNELLNLINL